MKYLRAFLESKDSFRESIEDIFEDYLDLFDRHEIKITTTPYSSKKLYIQISRDISNDPFRKRLEYQTVLNNCTKRLEALHEYDLIDIDITKGKDTISFKQRGKEKENSKGITVKDIKSFSETIPDINTLQPILVLFNIGEWNLETIESIDIFRNENRIVCSSSRSIDLIDLLDSISDFENPEEDGEIYYDDSIVVFREEITNNGIYLTNNLYLSHMSNLFKVIKLCKFSDLPHIVKDESLSHEYESVWRDEHESDSIVLICE